MNLAAPLDELFKWVDEIQGWLNTNKLIDAAFDAAMGTLFDFSDWIGQFASVFIDVVKEKVIGPMRPILDMIDAFLGAVNAVIDAIQTLIEWITNPIGSLVDAIY